MELTNESKQAMFESGMPEYMHGGIIRFYENGIPPGDFLTAVIDNDLQEAAVRADSTNIERLKNYVMWFYNYAPSGTWGFPGATDTWCAAFHKSAA